MLEHNPLILKFEHEGIRPREAEALQILRKVAAVVKPIMQRRGWKVGVLAEFWPAARGLLGKNHDNGQKICLRLRHPRDVREFLRMDEIVDVMLHELCHNVHYHHNRDFYSLWSKLRDELDELEDQGYTGEVPLPTAYKSGRGRVTNHEAQPRARAASEEHRTLTSRSSHNVGGAPVSRGIVANTARVENRPRTRTDEENTDEMAILLAYMDLERKENRYVTDALSSNSDNRHWVCEKCTLVNPDTNPYCDACGHS